MRQKGIIKRSIDFYRNYILRGNGPIDINTGHTILPLSDYKRATESQTVNETWMEYMEDDPLTEAMTVHHHNILGFSYHTAPTLTAKARRDSYAYSAAKINRSS